MKEFDFAINSFREEFPTSFFKDKKNYANWLAQTYYFVKHSTSLLGYAMPHLHNDDLRRHFEHHLSEETRHDLLAIKDMERVGHPLSEHHEYSATQAFYHSQYYRISFEGGTSLLGYILFLEGLAVHWGKEIHDDIKDTHKGSVLFLKVHAEEDPQHLQDAIKTIMALSAPEQEAIHRNFVYSVEMYREMLRCVFGKKLAVKKAA